MTVEEAIKIVARDTIAEYAWRFHDGLEWQDVAEVCEIDFEDIVFEVATILYGLRPLTSEVNQAMDVLRARVEPHAI
jgi:hypothetical protein